MNEENLIAILDKFKKKRIGVLGDVGIDRYTIGTVERVSPEAPVPILTVKEEKLKLGLASNVADNILALGGIPFVVGVVGADNDAKDFKKLCQEKKISTAFLVTDKSRRTILKERLVAETQQLLRVDFEDTNPIGDAVLKQVEQKAVLGCKNADAIIIEDYAKGLLSQGLIRKVTTAAKAKNIPVLVDPHPKTPTKYYSGITNMTPNRREAELMSGVKITSDKALEKAGYVLMEATKSKSMIITLGKDGMALFQKGKTKPTVIPTFAREVYDVSGAGDTVIAVMALATAAGASLEDAAMIANLAAGVVVGKRGTATVNRDEILQAFHDRRISGQV